MFISSLIDMVWRFIFVLCFLVAPLQATMPEFERLLYRSRVRTMFNHAYNSYIDHAFPADELRPLSCSGFNPWGGLSVTLVDTLDSLLVFGMHDEFHRRAHWISENVDVNIDVHVSVFETNIRVLGGLLAAHAAYVTGIVSRSDPVALGLPAYSDELLSLATALADNLMAAFDTPTGIPYGSLNLRLGVPAGETTVTCAACGGSFMLEFGFLSCFAQNDSYVHAAKKALRALYKSRSSKSLVGAHIDIRNGAWVGQDAGIGASVDSLFEYLLKSSIAFDDAEALNMYDTLVAAAERELRAGHFFHEVNMYSGRLAWRVANSLGAFWPGMLALDGRLRDARELSRGFHSIWRRYGGLPEGWSTLFTVPQQNQKGYPMRPELAESLLYLYRATKDSSILHMAADIVLSFNSRYWVPCGYAAVSDVKAPMNYTARSPYGGGDAGPRGPHEDRMESFLLSETLKYLYLLFDTDNIFLTIPHVFTTEGHPLPITPDCRAPSGFVPESAPSSRAPRRRRGRRARCRKLDILETMEINGISF